MENYSPHDEAVDVVITIHMAKLEVPADIKVRKKMIE